MNIHTGYFSISNPLDIVDKWLHPNRNTTLINIRNKVVRIKWTRRAEQALQQRNSPLIIEMQLYFSCTIKKRVLFHDQATFEILPVNKRFSLAFHPVESRSCDPLEFANNFPVKRKFDTPGSLKMRPSGLEFDFKNGLWVGQFTI